MSAIGPKRTWTSALHMSAFGGKAEQRPNIAGRIDRLPSLLPLAVCVLAQIVRRSLRHGWRAIAASSQRSAIEAKFTPALKPSMTLSDLREASMAKGRRGLDRRHRDRSGKIEKKHGNIRIGSLRREYGDKFARGCRKDMMLKTLLKETDCTSLHEYLRRHHK